MRKRNIFARMGILSVALLMSLGAMGTAYGVWSKTLSINSTVETGTVSANVSEEVSCYTDPLGSGGEITCNVVGNVLEVDVTNAEVGVDYCCDFIIENTGTIPVKIQSIEVSPLPAPEVEITGVAVGDQIDPEGWQDGTVCVSDNFTFTVSFSFVQWNQYVP